MWRIHFRDCVTHATPSLRVTELDESRPGRSLVTHYPKDYEDSEEGKDVNDEHASFECWQLAKKDGVEDDREQCRANRQQNAMPGRYGVFGIVQSNHTLHCQSGTIASAYKSSLPAENLGASQQMPIWFGDYVLTLSQPVMYDRNCWYCLGANSLTQ
jgi:hypothetical protein